MHSLTGTIRTASAFRMKRRQLAGIGAGCALALQLVLAATNPLLTH